MVTFEEYRGNNTWTPLSRIETFYELYRLFIIEYHSFSFQCENQISNEEKEITEAID